MKKKFGIALFGLFALMGLGFAFSKVNPVCVHAEEEIVETVKNTVVIEKPIHGSITASIEEGEIGDICVLEAKHDFLYKIDFIKVNGVALIEDEDIAGKFSFILVEGENLVTSSFVIDEELCGELTNVISQLENKDWKNLFTIENAITLVKWLLDGGILIALARYYIKDKRLEKKLEASVKDIISEMIPGQTQEAVLKCTEAIITPIFAELTAQNSEMAKAMNVFAKCMALSQENTPEARRAILDELSGLKIADVNTINEAKKYIEEVIRKVKLDYEEVMKKVNSIIEKNKENIEQPNEEETVKKEDAYDGTNS